MCVYVCDWGGEGDIIQQTMAERHSPAILLPGCPLVTPEDDYITDSAYLGH